jgi:hypothetical protein
LIAWRIAATPARPQRVRRQKGRIHENRTFHSLLYRCFLSGGWNSDPVVARAVRSRRRISTRSNLLRPADGEQWFRDGCGRRRSVVRPQLRRFRLHRRSVGKLHGSAVGVAGRNNWAVLRGDDLPCKGNIVCERSEGVLYRHHVQTFGVEQRNHFAPIGSVCKGAVDQHHILYGISAAAARD